MFAAPQRKTTVCSFKVAPKAELLEITDLIVDCDPITLERRPVNRAAEIDRLNSLGQHRAAKLVARLPVRDNNLDEAHVDALFVRAHSELQRLEEEFLQGERVRSLVWPLLQVLRDAKVKGPYRVVDVGCGLGYVTRWLAAKGGLGDDVELVGCDYNRALVAAATQAARAENLRCEFKVANAFRLADPATIFTSSGFIHHFRGDHLPRVFTEQDNAGAQALLHFDIKRTWLAPLGAWLFHESRMREPIARHDGTLSAIRAHPGKALLSAARSGAPGLRFTLFDGEVGLFPILRTMQALVGVRPALEQALRAKLGVDASRLGLFS